MSRSRMCQCGNCHKDVVMSSGNGVSISYYGQEKLVFCSGLHAALWLLGQDIRTPDVVKAIEDRRLNVERKNK